MDIDYTQYGDQKLFGETTFEADVEMMMVDPDAKAMTELKRSYKAYKKLRREVIRKSTAFTPEQELHRKAVARRKKRKKGGHK